MGKDITHYGGCHCGAVRYELQGPTELEVHDCNCSICSKVGYLHITVPKHKLKITAGADQLTTYRFNTGVAQHMFCSTCGIKSFYVPRSHPDGYSVNARTLDPGTVESMTIIPFEGADWENHISELPPLD